MSGDAIAAARGAVICHGQSVHDRQMLLAATPRE